jgi:large subunit ribosomal protein L29
LALLKTKDIRAMTSEERESKLRELRSDLMHERGVAAMGGAPKNPGKIQAIRRNISRMLTIIRDEERMYGMRKGGK